MEFRHRVKNRIFKRYYNYIIKMFKLRSLNFKMSQKIILFGVIFNFVALFFPWVNLPGSNLTYNAFSSISGNIGIILSLILLFLTFNLFSINNKEKLQLHISVHFRDYPVTIISGIIIFLLSIVSINFINAMQFFSSSIIYGSGIILSTASSIVIFSGGIIQRIEFATFSTRVKFYEPEKNINNDDELIKNNKLKNNMKLPF